MHLCKSDKDKFLFFPLLRTLMPQITKSCLIFPQISCDKVVHFLFTHTYFFIAFQPSCFIQSCIIMLYKKTKQAIFLFQH